MNAKEIHDLYAPLWERVPETRPRDLCEEDGNLFVEDVEDGDAIILAICRSAALEWLWGLGFSVDMGPYKSGGWFVEVDHMHHEAVDDRKPLDHALVAAAMKVAEKSVTIRSDPC